MWGVPHLAWLLTGWAAALLGAGEPEPRIQEYFGLCGASAAVAVDRERFLVASDEDSVLRLYRADRPGPPEQVFDLGGFLGIEGKHQETDLEAAARVGDRVYWITSHGRSADGQKRERRRRFFATLVKHSGGRVSIEPEGQPYDRLLEDLSGEPALRPYDLKAAAKKAPKEPGALNIEGLAATAEGHLWIGFRNPVPHGCALIVPLLNPSEVVAGQRARLGAPQEVDLGGLGIRDFCFADGRWLIVAGRFDGGGRSRLFLWDGGAGVPEKIEHTRLKGLNPEAAVTYPDLGLRRFQLLSDDGNREIDGAKCKDLKDAARQRFQSVWIEPQ